MSFDKVYVDGTLLPDANGTVTPDPLPPEEIATITVTFWDFTAPTTYEIKLVAKDNTQLTFKVKAKYI